MDEPGAVDAARRRPAPKVPLPEERSSGSGTFGAGRRLAASTAPGSSIRPSAPPASASPAAGLVVARDADAQWAAADRVPPGGERPGDLYFFARPDGFVYHVGLVVE